MEILTLPINTISINGGTQSRVSLNESTVAEYAEVIRFGGELPPVVVFEDGSDIWLADGFHRFHGHRTAGAMEINCDVRQGTKRDAILFSLGANAAHGLRRTAEDKRRAVMTLLEDAEWSAWSQERIAKAAGVSTGYVSKIVNDASLHGEEMKPAVRTVVRDGKEYQQNTANIGRKPQAAEIPPPPPAATPHLEQPSDIEIAQEIQDQAGDISQDLIEEIESLKQQIETLKLAADPEVVKKIQQLEGSLRCTETMRDDWMNKHAELAKEVKRLEQEVKRLKHQLELANG